MTVICKAFNCAILTDGNVFVFLSQKMKFRGDDRDEEFKERMENFKKLGATGVVDWRTNFVYKEPKEKLILFSFRIYKNILVPSFSSMLHKWESKNDAEFYLGKGKTLEEVVKETYILDYSLNAYEVYESPIGYYYKGDFYIEEKEEIWEKW